MVNEYDLGPERINQTIQAEATRLNHAVKNNAWHIPAVVLAAKEENKAKHNWFGLFKPRESEMSATVEKQRTPTVRK